MTDEQVKTAIEVLKAYIEKAFNVMAAEVDSDDYETPLTHSW